VGWTPHRGSTVIDTAGIQYRLTQPVAPAGGQGEVWETEAETVAVKVSNRSSSDIADRVGAVARLDIHDLPVAAPRVGLRPPAVGYVMNLVTGMMAIGRLGPVGHPFCHLNPPTSLTDWYVETGGMRKRLLSVAALADTLNELHSRGLVYADLNGGNALVSSRPDRFRVILIDLDNVQYADQEPLGFRRPEFAPPEFAETGATQSGDRFALCVLAWALLTTKNPFYGTALDDRPVHELNDVVSWALLAPMAGSDMNAPLGALAMNRVVPPRLRAACARTLEASDPVLRSPAAAIGAAARSGACAVTECVCGWQNLLTDRTCYRCDEPLLGQFVEFFDVSGGRHWPVPVLALSDQCVEIDRAMLGLAGTKTDAALRLHAEAGRLNTEPLTDDLKVARNEAGTWLERRSRSPLLMRIRAQ
jgi:eukaryotic-like serine/threonine-protein kinase